jgi:tRNA dimethylallyltransferase
VQDGIQQGIIAGQNSPDALPPAIFLMGPTAAGKTDVAIYLAQHLPVEIISVDSALVYRGMDIGTAKPAPEILRYYPHRLLDIRDPASRYSVAEFRQEACGEMQQISAAGKIPLLVGGSGLYFRALQHGLADMPSASPELRGQLSAEASRVGWPEMHRRLAELDAVSATRIHPNDPQRIQRALEVCLLTGQAMSALLAQKTQPLPYRIIKIVLAPSRRDELHERIASRFAIMLRNGLITEVTGLRQRGDLHLGLPSMRSVGYRQVWECLDGQTDYETMRQRAIIATRQLAKRQLTWLRGEPDAQWIDSQKTELGQFVLQWIQKKLSP